MGLFDFFKKNENTEVTEIENKSSEDESRDIVSVSEAMLAEVELDISEINPVKLPIEQIALLGAGVASLLPPLRTITQTISTGDDKLFRWVNGSNAAGTLKLNQKDNLLGGSFVDKGGMSRYAKFEHAGTQTTTTTSIMPIDPATLMMAAALASIEKKLDDVIEMEKQILSFLEEDKESEIEGDLKILTTTMKEFKYNWDNVDYKTNHHKLALDIKRTSEKNIIFYQKQISEKLKDNPVIHAQNFVDEKQTNLQKLFRYYRMSLYIYAFASYIEVMLLGNYQSEYINQVNSQIEEHSVKYGEIHNLCYERLEKYTEGSIDKALLKGFGTATQAVGNFIGNIPFIKEGQVDEWLVENGENLKKQGENVGHKTLEAFAAIKDTGSGIFVENLILLDRLYNKTTNIYIDKENVYLADVLV